LSINFSLFNIHDPRIKRNGRCGQTGMEIESRIAAQEMPPIPGELLRNPSRTMWRFMAYGACISGYMAYGWQRQRCVWATL